MYEKFTLTALSEIDGGRMAEAFHQALARLEADMHERPGAKSARTLTLTCTFKPVIDEEGDLDSAEVTFDVKEKIPKRESKTYNMHASKKNGGLFFNEMAPENANQRTIDEVVIPAGAMREVANAR